LCAPYFKVAANAAANQNKFEEYDRALYKLNFSPNDTTFFINVADSLGLNSEMFINNMRNKDVFSALEKSMQNIRHNGIINTPTILINHRLVSNYATYDQISTLVTNPISQNE
jgi:predicted DsbA family dithiol-disulfide isomerase